MTSPTRRKGALFDSYLMVDWSAASTPKRGKDSIWLAILRPGEPAPELSNPATRAEATAAIAAFLGEERQAGRRVLAGFDFSFGYPEGAARRICGPKGWSALWRRIDEAVEDSADNRSNRLDAAADLNAAWPADGPFWGNGGKKNVVGLGRTKPSGYGEDLPAEYRLVEERRIQAGGPRPKSCWQLAGAGAVGSQSLTGLKALMRLRAMPELKGAVEVWPFETGLAAPRAPICFAEIYPSLIPNNQRAGEVRDEAQMRAAATRFAALDQRQSLKPMFAGPEDLTAEERRCVVSEEGWILGVGYEEDLSRSLSPLSQPNFTETLLAAVEGAKRAPRKNKNAPADQVRANRRGERKLASGEAEPPLEASQRNEGRPALRLVSGAGELRYERDPAAIYAQSFDIVRRETRLEHLPADVAEVAVRLVHACGMPEITDRLAHSPDLAGRAMMALNNGAPVLCDCEMVASGVIRRLLPRENAVVCSLRDPRVPALAERIGNTRSAAAVELWRDRIDGAVVAIGNAPTALFHLLELLDRGWPRPAAILGFPVGFVGAAESKATLAANARGAAFLTLRGRRGGSAMASAAVNALASLAVSGGRSQERSS